jgi:hypothetical protein
MDHGVYYTRECLTFPLYKCFLQCWHTRQVFLLTCMRLFQWFIINYVRFIFTSHTHTHTHRELNFIQVHWWSNVLLCFISFFSWKHWKRIKINRSFTQVVSYSKNTNGEILIVYDIFISLYNPGFILGVIFCLSNLL